MERLDPMLSCRRFIAVFMIVLCLPGAALAAMPLRMCVGSDGHRVVEQLDSIGHHLRCQDSHSTFSVLHIAQSNSASGYEPSTVSKNCRDVLIGGAVACLRTATDGKRNATSNIPTFAMSSATVELPIREMFAINLGAARKAIVLDRDPRLVSHATVVLLN